MTIIIDDFFTTVKILLWLSKEHQQQRMCYVCQRSVPHTLPLLLGPLPTLLPCPWGLSGLPLHKWLLLPSRGYIRVCWWPHQGSPSGFVFREVSVHTPLLVTWKNAHQSPFSCRTQVWCGSELVDSCFGPEGEFWNKSCVYKGQLELQWQWRDWNITVPGTSYSWPWSSTTPQELFLVHVCVRP